jgi:DNA-binding IclR family transcriptional regulator
MPVKGYNFHMLSLEQVRRELKAIRDFDILFLGSEEHPKDDCLAFVLRQHRKDELTAIAQKLATRN